MGIADGGIAKRWWMDADVGQPFRELARQHELRDTWLDYRKLRLLNASPIAILGASLAIAGAAACSRMTYYSLDSALVILAAIEGST